MDVEENFSAITEIVKNNIHGKKQLGFLTLSQELVKNLRRKISDFSSNIIFELTSVILHSAINILENQPSAEDKEEDEDEGEESEEEGEGKGEEDEEKDEEKEASTPKKKEVSEQTNVVKWKKLLQNVRRLSLSQLGKLVGYFPEAKFSTWSMKLMKVTITSQLEHLTLIGRTQQKEHQQQQQLVTEARNQQKLLWKQQKLEQEQKRTSAGSKHPETTETPETPEPAETSEIAEPSEVEATQRVTHRQPRQARQKSVGSVQVSACLNWFLAMSSSEKFAKELEQQQGMSLEVKEGEWV